MPDTPASSSQRMAVPKRPRRSQRAHDDPDLDDRRAALAKVIPRRAAVSWWLGILLAIGFAALATPVITAERWLSRFQPGSVAEKLPAPFTVRAPLLAGYEQLRVRGGVVVARGEPVTRDQAAIADAIAGATPHGPALYLAVFTLTLVLAAIFTHHMRRSTRGRLVRVQIASLAVIAVIAAAVKLVMLSTALSPLVVPVAVLAMVPTMVLDRIVGLATGVLAALMVSLMAPFDVGLAILLLVQAATAGLVVTERPKRRWAAALGAGLVTTLCTGATYLLLTYLTTGGPPELRDPLHSTWVAAAVGPAIAAVLAVPLLPLYQLLVAEITQSKLFALEDLGHPLLREIAERAPGTWQHSLMMANMAEIAANAIGASGRLVRVGAYFHDLGKSLSPKYFIENLEPGESSPHDQLPPEVSCDAIFAHVTEGIVTARKAGLHERIVDFMHMHHGNGVLEYFWAKCREQGNPRDFTIEDFRYPGHPPQSRETAILAICDAVEAASRTLKKPDAASIDSLVQRIVYGKLHLGQLDECGLSMSDLRRISDSLRETIRHANHGRIEYPWQKAGQDASASVMSYSSTSPQLDSLDREPRRDAGARSSIPAAADSEAALAATADVKDPPVGAAPAARGATPRVESSDPRIRAGTARNAHPSSPPAGDSSDAGRAREVLAAEIREAEAREDETRGADAAIRDPGSAPIRVPGAQTRDAAAAGGDGAAAIHARASGAEIGDGTPGIRDPGSAPIRDPSSTMQDGAPIRDPAITKPGGASPSRDAGPVQAGARAAAPSREGVTTLPGRAPGPLAPPPDLITSQTFSDVPAPTARKPAMTAPPRRPETAPPQSESRNDAGEPARAAGSPAPVDFDSAITNPPPLRRGPSGHPPVPSDPAQIAVALASLASRVRAAPFGSPATTDDAAREAAQHVDLDSAITNPPPLGSLAPVTANFVDDAVIAPAIRSPGRGRGTTNPIDNAITRPLSPSPARAARTSDPAPGATTEPLLPRSPAPAPRTAELRTSGLADGERRPNPAAPPRDPALAEDRVTVRHRASTASGPLAIRPPAPWSDEEARITAPRPAARPRGSDATRVVQSEPDAYERPDAYEGPGSHEGPEAYEGPELHEAHDRHEAHEGHDRREVYAGHDARQPRDRRGDDAHDIDAGVTEPSMPMLAVGDDRRVDLSLRAVAASAPRERPAGWSSGLASRIDARLDSEEWNQETPIVPPTEAELRALHGQPDPTRQQPIDEIERLQRRAAELSGSDPPRRSPHPTAEVDPDDIEAAIELAPPARRPTHVNAIGATKPKPKPKKSE